MQSIDNEVWVIDGVLLDGGGMSGNICTNIDLCSVVTLLATIVV
jgi:hypothetical protein